MQNYGSHITTFITISTMIIFLLAGMIISILYLYQKKFILFRTSIKNMVLDHEKDLLVAQIEIQEQTFRDISREIHDNISLSLTLVKLELNTLDWSNMKKLGDSVRSSIGILSTAISELSNLSRSLNSDIIKNLGLYKAIKLEIDRIEQITGIQAEFEINGDPIFMECEKELIIFRIIQESFNNVIKHAGASKMEVRFSYTHNHLAVTIEDNGMGFKHDPHFQSNKLNSGLLNMQNRAKAFGGQMNINTTPGDGTTINITVPY
jgi:two-component system, NarL family, sensor kinase